MSIEGFNAELQVIKPRHLSVNPFCYLLLSSYCQLVAQGELCGEIWQLEKSAPLPGTLVELTCIHDPSRLV